MPQIKKLKKHSKSHCKKATVYKINTTLHFALKKRRILCTKQRKNIKEWKNKAR